jgi:hypothetical protein
LLSVGCVGQNFFHHGAPDWSYFTAALGAAVFFEAAGLGAFFTAGFLALVFAAVGFFAAFLTMMTSPPRRGLRPLPKVESPK